MHLDHLRHSLESLEEARMLLQSWGLRESERGWRNLSHLSSAIGVEVLRELCTPLARLLPRCPDPDMALNNRERFLAQPEGREKLPQLVEKHGRTLEVLLQLFSNSQSFSDQIVANTDFLDLVLLTLPMHPT